MKRYILLVLILLTFAGGGAWYWTSPERALVRMEAAIQSGDVARVEEVVDFPAVRKSAKLAIYQIMRQQPGFETYLEEHPEKVKEAERELDQMLAQSITPEAASNLLKRSQSDGPFAGLSKQSEGWSIRKDAWDRFAAVNRNPYGQLELKFERQGFDWRLVGVELAGMDLIRMGEDLKKTFDQQA